MSFAEQIFVWAASGQEGCRIKGKDGQKMGMIENDWLAELGEEFNKPYYKALYEFVKTEYNTAQIFPPADDIFNAFHLTPLSEIGRASCRERV